MAAGLPAGGAVHDLRHGCVCHRRRHGGPARPRRRAAKPACDAFFVGRLPRFPDALIARSASLPRIEARTLPPLDEVEIRSLPAVAGCSLSGGAWRIETSAVNRTLVALAAMVEAKGAELQDVQIHRPTLDDVFAELTGDGRK